MTRQEAYAKIKELNLQEVVLRTTGKNFTQTPTAILEKIINENSSPAASALPKKASVASKEGTIVDSPFEAAALTFLGVLKDAGVLDSLLTKL